MAPAANGVATKEEAVEPVPALADLVAAVDRASVEIAVEPVGKPEAVHQIRGVLPQTTIAVATGKQDRSTRDRRIAAIKSIAVTKTIAGPITDPRTVTIAAIKSIAVTKARIAPAFRKAP